MDKWLINRIGLINFWYYDDEEFQFIDGKLLLRGSNGSGKSVTMQSFIPLLLDGNKSPDRLDPFGSRARRLENYLVLEDSDIEDRTGYLYVEFVKPESNSYLTIGMGLRGRKNKPVDFWGFSISDGRRVGKDFLLYKELDEKVVLSKAELKNRVGQGGEVYERQQEYMDMVNRLLFGFENIDDYDELIKLLIQIRTPKLSKDFKPTVIYEILDNSLRQLSDEDLRPMSEAIENMDNIKTQLENLKQSKKAVEKINYSYNKYNKASIYKKSRLYLQAKDEVSSVKKYKEQLEKDKDTSYNTYLTASENIKTLTSEEVALKTKTEELKEQNADAFEVAEKSKKIKNELLELNSEKDKKQKELNQKEQRELEIRNKLRDTSTSRDVTKNEILRKLSSIDSKSEEIYFEEGSFMIAELKNSLEKKYSFEYTFEQVKTYGQRIFKIKNELQKLDIKKANYDLALKEMDEANVAVNDGELEVSKYSELFENLKEETIEKIYSWEKDNVLLKVSKESMISSAQKIKVYGEGVGYYDVEAPIKNEFEGYLSGFNIEKSTVQAELKALNNELKIKENEIKAWKSKKDPEPVRNESIVESRKKLLEKNIPFKPFYEVIDFCDLTDETLKGNLEEALLDMGLLDALVIPKEYREQALKDLEFNDKVIFAEPKSFKQDISNYLTASNSDSYVVEILNSILLDEENNSFYINENGSYSMGIIKGRISGKYKSKFIGSDSRKRYREEIIEKLTLEKEELEKKIGELENNINSINKKIEDINAEFKKFPAKDDIETAKDELKKSEIKLENLRAQYNKLEEKASVLNAELKKISRGIDEAAKGLAIPLNLKEYEDVIDGIEDYKDELRELQGSHRELLNYIDLCNSLEAQLEEIQYDLENLNYDSEKIQKSILINEEKIKTYEEILKSSNYQEIKDLIDESLRRLDEIPKLVIDENIRATKGKTEYDIKVEEIAKVSENLILKEQRENDLKDAFFREKSLLYVGDFENPKEVIESLRTEMDKINIEDCLQELQEKYHANMGDLVEYNIMVEHIFTDKSPEERRTDLKAKVAGKDISFMSLVKFIEDSIDENEKILTENDRQLFEDILINTISKKIKAKIYHAERWVKKMNEIMESMNTSSGLAFSLEWKAKANETEDQLKTSELVNILGLEGKLIREEDLKKITKHFRSKIAEARKVIEDTGNTRTLHVIIKEILDYRKWYEFKLNYKRKNENKKELTNNAFFTLSGGEKAMAMYNPLFAAAYARYEGAREDAPRIISLDEAFAGVDENNINDMFRIIEELKLNYIINSQILWGDYESVKGLSICELIRPNNAKFVSVIRYKWNGKVKELVLPSEVE